MGRPKAWLPVGGRTMLAAVVDAVERGLRGPGTGSAAPEPPVVVVGAPGGTLPPLPGKVLRATDRVEGEGPLRGMQAGLAALAGKADAAFVSSCDTPLLKPAFVARMVRLLGGADAAVPLAGGRHHPLAGVYRLTLRDLIGELLLSGLRRPFFLFERVPTRAVGACELAPVDPELDSLKNFNTPEEYRALISVAAPAGDAP